MEPKCTSAHLRKERNISALSGSYSRMLMHCLASSSRVRHAAAKRGKPSRKAAARNSAQVTALVSLLSNALRQAINGWPYRFTRRAFISAQASGSGSAYVHSGARHRSNHSKSCCVMTPQPWLSKPSQISLRLHLSPAWGQPKRLNVSTKMLWSIFFSENQVPLFCLEASAAAGLFHSFAHSPSSGTAAAHCFSPARANACSVQSSSKATRPSLSLSRPRQRCQVWSLRLCWLQ
mmetsp:Transcript_63218/g.181813  ORF Transcript_63218/g.181813 Transcript_63218/m.181813 type:complete len:234 (-) Transcript_63218:1201-1902(-)